MSLTITIDNKYPLIPADNCKHISSRRDFENFFNKNNKFKGIFILAELDWVGLETSQYYGLELARELRQKYRVKAPIAVCSFWPREHFVSSDNPDAKGNILNSPLVDFIRIQERGFSQYTFPNNELDELLLDDIIYSFFNFRGIAGELMHNLDNWLTKSISLSPTVIANYVAGVLQQIKALVDPEKVPGFEGVCKELNDKIIDEKGRSVDQLVKSYTDRIYSMLSHITNDKDLNEKPTELSSDYKWSIIVVDDNAMHKDKLVKAFEERCLTVHSYSFPQEAVEGLVKLNSKFEKSIKKDKKSLKDDIVKVNAGKPAVLITDLRFINQNGKWTDLQGFQLAKRISQESMVRISTVIVTNKRGTILKQIQKLDDFEGRIFYKSDIFRDKTSLYDFVYQIIRIGNDAFFTGLNKPQPKLSTWLNGSKKISYPLAYHYQIHCMAKDYKEAEEEINKKALSYYRQYENNNIGENLKPSFSIAGTPLIKKNLDNFRSKVLLYRRIIWALFANFNPVSVRDFEKKIYNIITNTVNDDHEKKIDAQKKQKNSIDQVFNTILAISFKGKEQFINRLTTGRITEYGDLLEEEVAFLESIWFTNDTPVSETDKKIIDDLFCSIDCYSTTIETFNVNFFYQNLHTSKKLARSIRKVFIDYKKCPNFESSKKDVLSNIQDSSKQLEEKSLLDVFDLFE